MMSEEYGVMGFPPSHFLLLTFYFPEFRALRSAERRSLT